MMNVDHCPLLYTKFQKGMGSFQICGQPNYWAVKNFVNQSISKKNKHVRSFKKKKKKKNPLRYLCVCVCVCVKEGGGGGGEEEERETFFGPMAIN